MAHQIIFIGGIHGVGKTEFCQKVSRQLNISHLSASTLIRQAGQSIIPGQKRVAAVSENQDLLIQSLRNYQSRSRTFLLDGHFCLLDKNSDIQAVPLITFKQIAPRAVLVLVDEPDTIAGRITARDNVPQNKHFTAEFQIRELDHAQVVCNSLNVPLYIHSLSDRLNEALDFIRNHLS